MTSADRFKSQATREIAANPDLFRKFRLFRKETRDEQPAVTGPQLAEEAYYGAVGDLVKLIEPHTEADPAAVLVQALVAVGNLIGRNPYFQVEADRHYSNLYAVVVGESSKARKGTSLGHVTRTLAAVDESWSSTRIQTGLSSGEGLIWAVRDAIQERQGIKEKGRVVEYEWVETDPGVDDKRLLIVEPEFGRVLQVCERETNTLSALIRQAWDTGNLRTLTKRQSAVATDAHVSIIGHVTQDELRRLLTDTQAANGFANRFLWVFAKRSKELPDGGRFDLEDVAPIQRRIAQAATFARTAGRVVRDEGAKEAWHAVYSDLSAAKPGLAGAATSRAEAITTRLSLLYALLDCSTRIRAEHLTAALAVWGYCERSAWLVFGDAVGDPVADTVLHALQESDGLTRTDISNLFNRNQSRPRLDYALGALEQLGLIAKAKVETGGRPSILYVSTKETNLTN